MLSKASSSLTPSTEVDSLRALVEHLAAEVGTLKAAFIKSKSLPLETAPVVDLQRVVTEVIEDLNLEEPELEMRVRVALERALRRQPRVEDLSFWGRRWRWVWGWRWV